MLRRERETVKTNNQVAKHRFLGNKVMDIKVNKQKSN